MQKQKPYVVGIDIGGTNTVFGIVDARGNVLASNSIKTQKHLKLDDYVDELYEELSKIIDDNTEVSKIKGIGIGAPNANHFDRTIEHAPNLPWKGVIPFAEIIEKKTGLPVAITNDANAAAIGEMTYGAARGMRDFIMITLGTGVGSGIVSNGAVIYGNDSFAGELGHVTMLRQNGRLCGCGLHGCLETYASATGVALSAREFLSGRPKAKSVLNEFPPEAITSKDVFEAAFSGDKLAQDVFKYTGQILGQAFADFVKFTSPEAIVVFGGLSKAGDLLLKPVKESMEKNLMPIFRNKVKIIQSELKEADAAVLGASALAWEIKEESED